MFTKLISALKATRRTIVFTEGPDARILEAADRLIKDDLMDVILIGNVDEVKAAAAKGGFDIARPRSSTRPPTPVWMRWSQRWSSCARARCLRKTAAPRWPRATISAPCSSRWARPTRCSAARPTHRRYRPSGSAAGQDEEGRAPRLLLLHPLPQATRTATTRVLHGRLRHQHRLSGRR